MSVRPPFFLVLVFAVVSTALATAQDSVEKPVVLAPAVVQEKVREWVRVQKTISAEKSDWVAQKAMMAELNALRKKEIAQLDEHIAAAGTRLTDAEKQRTELLAEEETLRTWRAGFEKRVVNLEAGIRAQIPAFPPPLLKKIDQAVARIQKQSGDNSLQNRFRDVVAILTEAGNFENTITVATENRPIGEQKIEVDVLYLGLKTAFYVDRAGNNAGTGQPSKDGWIWTPENRLAGKIADAIAIHRKEKGPAFIELPIGGKEGVK